MKKVLIADDHVLFSMGIANMMRNHEGLTVVKTVDNGIKVMQAIREHHPDILLLDLNLPGMNGIEILEEARKIYKSLIVVIVTMYNDLDLVQQVRQKGGNAYLLKNCAEEELISTLLHLNENKFYVSKGVTGKQQDEFVKDEFADSTKITSREKEILRLIAMGKSAKEIGDMLHISSATVDTHRKNMMKKLSVNKVSELVAYAHRNELV